MKNNNYRYSFSFFFLLNLLNISVPENAEPVINYSFGVFSLSILIFFCIINAFLSLFSLYFISKYDITVKLENYPKLIKIIKYYENSSLFYIFIEIIMALLFTLLIILSSLFFLGINIF
jgi:hypothetical protein